MKYVLVAFIGILSVMSGAVPAAQAQSLERCVQPYDKKIGNNCGNPNSVSYRFKNSCSVTIDMRFCLERTNGKWDCGTWLNTKPGASTSTFVCSGTGNIMTWGRQSGDTSIRFPTQSEINQ